MQDWGSFRYRRGNLASGSTALVPVVSAGYTGPGDIVTFTAWWGLRAYSNATIGTSVADVFGRDTSTTFTFVSKADGSIELSAGGAGAFISSNSSGGMVVVKAYDQTGNGRHLTASGAPSPAFPQNVLGSYPVVRFIAPNVLHATGFALSQPWTASHVFKITTSSGQESLQSDSTNYGLYISSTTKLRLSDSGTLDSAVLSTGTWYPTLAVFNGTSSVNRVAATEVTGTVGATGQTAAHIFQVGLDDFSQQFLGDMVEWGIVASAVSSGNRSSLISNQQTFWGI